ncbi:MAG: peroxiredoxin family protein, partial [Bradymonadaceae bacterium]
SLLLIPLGCDREASDEVSEESTQEEAAVAEEEKPEDTRDAPRLVETQTPADDLIGILPEGLGLAVGEFIPDVQAKDAKGNDVNLSTLAEGKAMLVVFYRGGWCPFCNFQIRELTQSYSEFSDRDVVPVAISVDRVEESARTQATYTIPFPVLSDQDLAVHKGFGVIQEVAAEDVERMKKMGMDLEESSGRKHHTVAVPGIFLVDGQGVVRWAHANEDYRVRPSIEQLLKVLDEVDLSAAAE